VNIVIGKIGRSIYFNETGRSMTAGDEEAPMMYTMLAERHPEHNFYLIGRSDLTRIRQKENTDT